MDINSEVGYKNIVNNSEVGVRTDINYEVRDSKICINSEVGDTTTVINSGVEVKWKQISTLRLVTNTNEYKKKIDTSELSILTGIEKSDIIRVLEKRDINTDEY